MSAAVCEAWIGLGSNVGGPAERVRDAMEALDRIPGTRFLARSSLYGSAPMGPRDQPPFVNAVAGVETRLLPRVLLAELQAIERDAGRERSSGQRWGPRRLDLDLLVYGMQRSDDPALTLPHPGAATRAFVLVPWAEVAPDTRIPGAGRVGALAPCETPDVWRWTGTD
jgi:2-amino-4-hydroxy-6-hydroxymethyldihydropteridine diphosphokinase